MTIARAWTSFGMVSVLSLCLLGSATAAPAPAPNVPFPYTYFGPPSFPTRSVRICERPYKDRGQPASPNHQ